MRYHPKHRTCEELLTLRGFTHTGPGVGWEKCNIPAARVGKYDRLHASTHYGYINMHFDLEEEGKKHVASGSHHSVRREIRLIEELDTHPIDRFIRETIVGRFLQGMMEYFDAKKRMKRKLAKAVGKIEALRHGT